jgi:hypothetical protein
MPLSEQEQRLLDEMERHLMHNDADVVSAARNGRTISYRNIVYGTVLVLLGLGALVAGVVSQLIVVGVLGFVLMVVGVVLAATPNRTKGVGGESADGADAPSSSPTSKHSHTFMDRMNDRWDRRQDDH